LEWIKELDMKKTIYLVFILVLFLATACQAGEKSQDVTAATMTFTTEAAIETTESPTEVGKEAAIETASPIAEEPTETMTTTATETLTPTATETLTPENPPTETIPATPDPGERLGGIRFDERFDGSSGWGWTYVEDEVVTFGLQSGGVLAAFQDSNQGWRISLGPDSFSAGDQRVQVTAQALACGDQDEWGLLYRSEFTENGKFNGYVFKLNCAGQVRVERLQENQSSVLLGWVLVDGANKGAGGENTLMIWAVGSEMRFYVNDIYVGTVMDENYESGEYGIYAQDRTNGNAEFLFVAMRVYQITLE
jgi:hypothetical protein